MINFFVVFGAIVHLKLAHNLPLTEKGLNKLPGKFDSVGNGETSLFGDETVNGLKQQIPVPGTPNLLEIASITLPLLTFIHESDSSHETLQQLEGGFAGENPPKVTTALAAEGAEFQGILKYPEVVQSVGFAPILVEPIHSQESILLPLITDEIQTLSLPPTNEASKNPANLPAEKERTSPSSPSPVQVGSAASMVNPKQSLPQTTTEQNSIDPLAVSANSQQPAAVYTPTVAPRVEGSQKTVSSSRQEVVRTVEESGNPNLVLEVTTHAPEPVKEFSTGVTGEFYHHLVLVGSPPQEFSQDQVSVQQTSDKAVDKLCLILTRK